MFDLKDLKSKDEVLETIVNKGIRAASLDIEGNLIITTEKTGPVKILSPKGQLSGEFLTGIH